MALAEDMRAAVGLLTVLPVGGVEPGIRGPRVSAWFPAVGLVLGAIAYAPVRALAELSVRTSDGGIVLRASLVFAGGVLLLEALLTRFLHWDGLADLADAWWGGYTVERRLEIMSDSSVGAFGVAAVAFVMLLQAGSLATVFAHGGPVLLLLAVPVFGRMAATFGAWLGRPARPGGLGASVVGAPRLSGIVVAAVPLALAAAAMMRGYGLPGLVWSLLAFLSAAVVPHVCAKRVGGVTGDVLGASVLLTETVVLVIAAIGVVW